MKANCGYELDLFSKCSWKIEAQKPKTKNDKTKNFTFEITMEIFAYMHIIIHLYSIYYFSVSRSCLLMKHSYYNFFKKKFCFQRQFTKYSLCFSLVFITIQSYNIWIKFSWTKYLLLIKLLCVYCWKWLVGGGNVFFKRKCFNYYQDNNTQLFYLNFGWKLKGFMFFKMKMLWLYGNKLTIIDPNIYFYIFVDILYIYLLCWPREQ